MLYLRFKRAVALGSVRISTQTAVATRNKWNLFEHVKSQTVPLATITRTRGKCSAAITEGHTLNREHLACVLAFMQERERV